ncbi:chromate transporter [Bradyrhizobium sp. RDM4]|uniref:chromate transporter n=1 Tax=Bradyrhizobium sp. RDM4 TaxID=3378765 RepID=UPI0038FC11D7
MNRWVIQESLVNHYHVLTNEQLNEAVVITRSSPGPVGLYVVSVGYFVARLPGAVAGWLAMITPALLIIPLVHFVGRRMSGAIRAADRHRQRDCCSQPPFRSDWTASPARSPGQLRWFALCCC